MYKSTFTKIRTSLLLLGIVVAICFAALQPHPASAKANAATLPADTCTLVATTRTCDLYATTGTLALPGGVTVNVWGYALDGVSPAQVPGPVLIANAGETLVVNLHNNLGENTSLSFPQLPGPSDLTGAASGGTTTYTFANLAPGTFIYEAGPTTNGQRQVAMGMYGALVVRPAGTPTQAYGSLDTAFDDEALLIMSEIDPALNASPATFDLRNFNPKYWLFNGQAYPDTAPIATAAGNRVLLRLVNAGLQNHSVGVLGLRYTVLSIDGNPFAFPHDAVSETLGAGQTADVLTNIPAAAPFGMRYALYDTSVQLRNAGSQSLGGMLTFLEIPAGGVIGDFTGPAATSLALSPLAFNGSVDVTFTASVSDAASGGANIASAETFIGAAGASGSGIAMTAVDGTFDSATEAVTATLPAASFASFATGNLGIYIHAQDAGGNWGSFNYLTLKLDKTGPASTGGAASPNPSFGSSAIVISATANDSASGNTNILAAEYFIDATGANGTGAALTLNQVAPIVSLTATIPAPTVAALSEGNHTIYIHSQDELLNWGPFSTLTLGIDKSGPATSGVAAAPSPNNGTIGISASQPSVRVDATVSEPGAGPVASAVKAVEMFIDATGPNGTGVPMTPRDGAYNTTSEGAYAFINLPTIKALSEGTHVINVHGRDAAGNWGPFSSASIVVDKTLPAVSSLAVTPNPTNGASTLIVNAAAADLLSGGVNSNIAQAEWFEATDPGPGNGHPMFTNDGSFNSPSETLYAVINVSGWTSGNHLLFVRAKDKAGNWSAPLSISVVVTPVDNIFADSFESGNIGAWTSSTGTSLTVVNSNAMGGSGTRSLRITLAGNAQRFVTTGTPNNETRYLTRFYFNPNGALTGNNGINIFGGFNAANTNLFSVQYRHLNGGNYQVRAIVRHAGGNTPTGWFNVSNTAHAIEIEWNSGASSAFRLYIDGTLRQTITGLNTSAYLLDSARLGVWGGQAVSSGNIYLDAFISKRLTRP